MVYIHDRRHHQALTLVTIFNRKYTNLQRIQDCTPHGVLSRCNGYSDDYPGTPFPFLDQNSTCCYQWSSSHLPVGDQISEYLTHYCPPFTPGKFTTNSPTADMSCMGANPHRASYPNLSAPLQLISAVGMFRVKFPDGIRIVWHPATHKPLQYTSPPILQEEEGKPQMSRREVLMTLVEQSEEVWRTQGRPRTVFRRLERSRLLASRLADAPCTHVASTAHGQTGLRHNGLQMENCSPLISRPFSGSMWFELALMPRLYG